MKLLLRDILRFAVVALILLVGLAVFQGLGYRINLTSSIPSGLYQIWPVNRPIERGDIVWFCPPDTPLFRKARDEWKDIPSGTCPGDYTHMFKPVAALPGDWVTVTLQGVFVNGRRIPNSQSLTGLSDGRALHPMLGTYRVKFGTVWLVSHFNARSFDSRYVGPISTSQIEAFARPVWVRKE